MAIESPLFFLRNCSGSRIVVSDAGSCELTAQNTVNSVTALKKILRQHDTCGLALMMDNSPAQLIADLATLEDGFWNLPLPPFFTTAQRRHAMSNAGCGHLLTDLPLPAMVDGAFNEGVNSSNMDAQSPPALKLELLQEVTVAGRALFLYRSATTLKSNVLPGTAKLTFTSGSTGTPRGLCLSLEQLMEPVASIQKALEPLALKGHLSALPYAVLLENIAGIYTSLLEESLVLLPSLGLIGHRPDGSFHAASYIDCINTTGAQSTIMVPEMLRTTLDHVNKASSSLRFIAVGGAHVHPELLQRAGACGLPAYEGYGLSEAGSVCTLNLPGATLLGSVGRPLGHRKLSVSATGELLLDKPGFLGWCGEPVNQEDSYATGDIGLIDEDGFVHINGRSKNLIITAMGRNVSPEWVESYLMTIDGIEQAVVHGDAERVLSALIVSELDTSALNIAIENINQNLPVYARIGHWQLTEPMSAANGLLTTNGKLRREAILATRTLTVKTI